jgi:hypothetical protein
MGSEDGNASTRWPDGYYGLDGSRIPSIRLTTDFDETPRPTVFVVAVVLGGSS